MADQDPSTLQPNSKMDSIVFSLINLFYYYIYIFYTFFTPVSWYPIGSYSLVSSLQLPYGLGRGEGREPCVLETQPNQATWLLDTMPT